ncbi:LysE family translocator [Diplocloster hominis]|uniref:LysE family translocator n=1 Tax=Diplocloster hominis TaxID=3079010 RepID=UPI0031B9F04D
MTGFLLRGILTGLLFGVPAGAVGAMTVQRTLHYGVKAGLLMGLGSSAADTFYACVGAFGLTVVSDALLESQDIIHCLGGCLILGMGICLLLKKGGQVQTAGNSVGFTRTFFSAFAVGITNPAAILTFLLAFSWFGISGQTGWSERAALVLGVFIGTYIWWGLLTAGVAMLKKRARTLPLGRLNRIFGTLLLLLGTGVLVGVLCK